MSGSFNRLRPDRSILPDVLFAVWSPDAPFAPNVSFRRMPRRSCIMSPPRQTRADPLWRSRYWRIGLGAAPIFLFDATVSSVSLAPLYAVPLLVTGMGASRPGIARVGAGLVALALLGHAFGRLQRTDHEAWLTLVIGLCVLVALIVVAWIKAPQLGRAETAADDLRLSEGRYRAMFDAAGFAIWEADWSRALAFAREARAAGEKDLEAWFLRHPEAVREAAKHSTLSDANPQAAKLFGVTQQALIGGGITAFRTPSSEKALAHIFASIFDGDATAEAETRFLTAQGRTIDVIFRVTLPPNHDEWRRVFVMAVDVTDWHEAQKSLNQAQADLARASRVTTLGQLSASIAHEINQPLAALITYAKSGRRWLAREAPEAPETAACLTEVVANGERAADIVSRIRTMISNSTPTFAPLSLRAAVAEAARLVRREAELLGADIEVQLPPDSLRILGDRVQVQQVIVNLVLNAAQAMHDSPVRRITVLGLVSDERVTLEVVDTGPGFGSVAPEEIFEPFFTTKTEGMGMGLAICRSIITPHGGQMRAENREGGGARIILSFPKLENQGITE